jgi:hypothetical protein
MSTDTRDTPPRREALLAEYSEVNSNYRALADIRFKLLGLLPIATGAGVVLFARDSLQPVSLPIGILGLLVSLGIFIYDRRNTQLYFALGDRAKAIEKELGLPDGQFTSRPKPELGFLRHGVGSGLIYVSVFSGWTYIIVLNLVRLCQN